MDVIKMLKGHDLFKSFLPEQVEAISRFSSPRVLEKGAIIYVPDRKASHVFVLLAGKVELRMPAAPGDAGMLVGRVGKGDLFGIAPLLGSDRYTARAQCVEASRVLFVEAKPLIQMLESHPAIGKQIMTVVARSYFDRYRMLMERVQRLMADLGQG